MSRPSLTAQQGGTTLRPPAAGFGHRRFVSESPLANPASQPRTLPPPIFGAADENETQSETTESPLAALPTAIPISTDYWKSQKITGKIIEAKYLEWDRSDGSCDPYCIARVDNHLGTEFRTQTIFGSSTPFWSEDFSFESVQGFKNIKFVVWNENRDKPENSRPIGKVVFPKSFLRGEDEQWFTLHNAESEVTIRGQVRLRIKHFPPKRRRQVHGFSVCIISARDLYAKDAQHYPNPYAVFHMLPDSEAISTQQTRVQTRTINPTFSETFFFTFNATESIDREIHCSLWDQVNAVDGDQNGFLGHVIVPLAPIVQCQRIERWFSLSLTPFDIAPSQADRKLARTRKKSITEEEKRNRPRELVKSLQRMDASSLSPQAQKSHQFSEVAFAFSTCSHCNNVLIGTHLQCTNCSVVLHQKCKEAMVPMCGGVGALRLRIRVCDTIVLPLQLYSNFINLMQENNYYLPSLLGRVSQEREDAARCLIRIFGANGTVLRFLKACMEQELTQAPDSKTLFRANSMASKAVDVFMKHIAHRYLKETLEGPLREIIGSGKSAELDPLKMDRPEKNEKDSKTEKNDRIEKEIQKNVITLIKFVNMIVAGIFSSVSRMPEPLRDFFWFLQSTVIEKFSNDPTVRYTAISGFLFLRFFAPAVLGPRLFGLDVGPIDARAGRNLVLVAKTLQNLSNLVEFGHKEPYMESMNPLIQSRMNDMRKYIDTISNRSIYPETNPKEPLATQTDIYASFEGKPKEVMKVARECADLQIIFSASLDKMSLAAEPGNLLVQALTETISMLEEIRRRCEPALKERDMYLLPWLPASDDIEDEIDAAFGSSGAASVTTQSTSIQTSFAGLPVDPNREEDEERKIIRMLTRCSSNSIRSSLGSFRHSTELRDSMIKGQVKNEPVVPLVPIAAVLSQQHTIPQSLITSFMSPISSMLVNSASSPSSNSMAASTATSPTLHLGPIQSPPENDQGVAQQSSNIVGFSSAGDAETPRAAVNITLNTPNDNTTRSQERLDRPMSRTKVPDLAKIGRSGSDASINSQTGAGGSSFNAGYGSSSAMPSNLPAASSGLLTVERTRSKRESTLTRFLPAGLTHFGKHSTDFSSNQQTENSAHTELAAPSFGSASQAISLEKQSSPRLWGRRASQIGTKLASPPIVRSLHSNSISMSSAHAIASAVTSGSNGSAGVAVRSSEILPDPTALSASGKSQSAESSEMVHESNGVSHDASAQSQITSISQESTHGRATHSVASVPKSTSADISDPTILSDVYCECGLGGDVGDELNVNEISGSVAISAVSAELPRVTSETSSIASISNEESAGTSRTHPSAANNTSIATKHGQYLSTGSTTSTPVSGSSGARLAHTLSQSAAFDATCPKCGRSKLPQLQRLRTTEAPSQLSAQPQPNAMPSSTSNVPASGSTFLPTFFQALHHVPSTKREKRHTTILSAVNSISNLVNGGGSGASNSSKEGGAGANSASGAPGVTNMPSKQNWSHHSRRTRDSTMTDDSNVVSAQGSLSVPSGPGSSSFSNLTTFGNHPGGGSLTATGFGSGTGIHSTGIISNDSSNVPATRKRSNTSTKREQINLMLMNMNLCGRCGQDLQEAVFEADGKRYHPQCLTCKSCDTHLTSSLISWEGEVICRDCYLRKTGLVCGKCNKLIYSEYLTILGRNYHATCRKCDLCAAELGGNNKEHFTLGDQVFCIEHRETLLSCHVCRQRIDGPVFIAGGDSSGQNQRYYHPAHFCCSSCGKDLAATVFYEMDGRPWCQTCLLDHSERTPPGSTSAPSSPTAEAFTSATAANLPAEI